MRVLLEMQLFGFECEHWRFLYMEMERWLLCPENQKGIMVCDILNRRIQKVEDIWLKMTFYKR